jgi:hypothetical protein
MALEEEAAVEMHPEIESALKDVPIKQVGRTVSDDKHKNSPRPDLN